MLVLIAAGAWWFLNANRPAATAHLSIVVLPFTNLSGDPAQDYFADGITENLTTDLSRIRDSFVIARNTAFAFKGKTIDAKEIGKELGVRYVLEGSVQRDQNRMRVNAQLIDAQSGAHLWADRFEEDAPTCSSCRIRWWRGWPTVWAMNSSRRKAEKGGHSKTPTPSISSCAAGRCCSCEPITRDNNDAARVLFERALAIDPNDAAALAGNAHTYTQDYVYGWTDPQTRLRR